MAKEKFNKIYSDFNCTKEIKNEIVINPEDLKFIMCDGKKCDPVICFRTSCKVFEYWSNKGDSKK